MRFDILEDEIRVLSAAPRTLSEPLKCREKRTISVAAHNNQCGGLQVPKKSGGLHLISNDKLSLIHDSIAKQCER